MELMLPPRNPFKFNQFKRISKHKQNMKKTLVSLSLCALVAFGATSCKKDVEQNGEYQFRATVENCSDAKTTYNGTAIQWNANDTVMIYGLVPGRYVATPEEGNPGSAKLRRLGAPVTYMGDEVTAIYPAALANSASNITLPALQETEDGNLMSNFPMIATSTDENLYFKNLCGALKVHLEQENVSIYKIEVTAETAINGTFDIDNSGENPVLTNGTEGTTTTTLICTTPQDITGGHDFFVTMPAGNYQNLQVTIYRYDNAKRVKTAPAGATIAIERSHYFTLNIATDFAPDPFIDGLISVSDNKQVYFAKGNLIYENNAWRLGNTQYEHYNNATNNGPRDMFHPSTVASNYGLDTPGEHGDMDYADFVDWGVTVNTDNANDPWYTLTRDEWAYALNKLAGTSAYTRRGHNHNLGRINLDNGTSVDGLILVPDNYNDRDTTGGKHFNGYGGTMQFPQANVYTLQEWAAMEAAGAVFIPCMETLNEWSRYWTATEDPSHHALWKLHFKLNNHAGGSGQTYNTHNVRLVKTANEQ